MAATPRIREFPAPRSALTVAGVTFGTPPHPPLSAASRERQRVGAAAEAAAAQLLQSRGFTLVARNYRCRGGELDIVARRGQLLVIAEVRLRSRQDFGGAAASINAGKRRRLWLATRWLLAQRPQLAKLEIRFDALLVSRVDGPIEWLAGIL